jgi:hypothetical protein
MINLLLVIAAESPHFPRLQLCHFAEQRFENLATALSSGSLVITRITRSRLDLYRER